jgi:FkbM family methyltransferase
MQWAHSFKCLVKNSLKHSVSVFARALPHVPDGPYLFQQLLESGMGEYRRVEYKGVVMKFNVPNALCRYRAESFSSKEPETLTWLEGVPEVAVLWDIGANVGLYSIYAARKVQARVFAFEPSVFNLELLARNIFLNGLQDRVTIVPVELRYARPQSIQDEFHCLGPCLIHTFGQDFDQHGGKLNSIFEYQTMGVAMNDAIRLLGIPAPRFIKVDVDGIEHFILRGGADVLRQAESVLIEINDDFAEQAEESAQHLQEAGLTLLKKCGLDTGNQYNQWWVRQSA